MHPPARERSPLGLQDVARTQPRPAHAARPHPHDSEYAQLPRQVRDVDGEVHSHRVHAEAWREQDGPLDAGAAEQPPRTGTVTSRDLDRCNGPTLVQQRSVTVPHSLHLTDPADNRDNARASSNTEAPRRYRSGMSADPPSDLPEDPVHHEAGNPAQVGNVTRFGNRLDAPDRRLPRGWRRRSRPHPKDARRLVGS